MKLYELNEEISLAETLVEQYAMENEGDITDCPYEKILDDLKMEKEEKLLGIATWYKNMNSDVKALAEEIKILTDRKRVLSNKSDRIKGYIEASLEKGKKISNTRSALSWRKSQTVQIFCEASELAPRFQKIKVEASKADLKTALKAGEEIKGVELTDNLNLQIK